MDDPDFLTKERMLIVDAVKENIRKRKPSLKTERGVIGADRWDIT